MKEVTYIQAVREALDEEMTRDDKVFLLGEDIGPQGGVFHATEGLLAKYGTERVRQTPIAECSIVGAACGASMMGLRPVAELMYLDFVTIGMDQLVNQIAKIRYISNGQVKLPLVIRTQGGGGRGKGPHHSQSLESWFLHVPGLKVIMPSSPYDAKGLLKSAIRDDSPVLFIENAILYNTKGNIPEEEYTLPLGKADIKMEGNDITIAAVSYMVQKSLEAAAELKNEGISAEVVDIRSVYPLDIDTISDSVKKTSRLLVVHEACKRGGIGGEIVSQIVEDTFDYLDAPAARIGGLETPMPYAESLEKQIIPDTEKIVVKVKKLLGNI